MKKSLIALAAVAASGAAFAQSSVTLFGVVDTAVTVYDGKNTVSGLGNSGNSSTRLGFRGVEDLGNGLKAGFWLEGALGTDDGSGVGGGALGAFEFKRRSTISLMGNFGELRLGRDLTAAYSAVSRYDVFGTVGVAGSGVWGDTSYGGVRRDNMIAYLSPDFSGFKLNLNYAFGERVQKAEDPAKTKYSESRARTGDYYGMALTYDNGPLSLGLSYFEQGRDMIGGEYHVDQFKTPLGAETENGFDRNGWALGGSYDFGVVKLSAAYQASEAEQRATEGGVKRDYDNYMIGLSAPVGAAGELKASYNNYQGKERGVAGKDKADQFSLGYVHNLSKRTAVYGTYSYLKNKRNGEGKFSGYSLGGAGMTKPANDDNGKIQAFQIGVRHNF